MSVIYASVPIRRKKRTAAHGKKNNNNCQKDKEVMAQANRQKGSFMVDLGHELRAPLTAMRGLIEPLADGMVKDEQKKLHYYQILLAETERLTRLINDMTASDRINKTPRLMDEIDVSAMLFDMAHEFSKETQDKKIHIKADVDQNIRAYSNNDGVRQILTVLIENAIIHSHNDESIRIFTESADEFGLKYKDFALASESLEIPKEKIIINVEDQGLGIDKNDISHVFERAFSADKLRPHGTGLGLYIAKRIADELGETIIIQSKKGVGTISSLTLSLKKQL